MKKLSISLTLVAALDASASAAEVTPFGFIGGYYSQGFSNMPTQTSATNSKEVGEAYAAVAAHLGLDVGLSPNISFGLGFWGGLPLYETYYTGGVTPVGDRFYPQNWDVSDAYLKFDSQSVSVIGGRFDVSSFYHGKDGKDYTGMDWLWGNIQGAAFNMKSKNIGFWALWMNSKLGVNGNYNRMAYDMASFGTYSAFKHNHVGEVFMGGVDFDYDTFKFSPFVIYDTNHQHSGTAGTRSVPSLLDSSFSKSLKVLSKLMLAVELISSRILPVDLSSLAIFSKSARGISKQTIMESCSMAMIRVDSMGIALAVLQAYTVAAVYMARATHSIMVATPAHIMSLQALSQILDWSLICSLLVGIILNSLQWGSSECSDKQTKSISKSARDLSAQGGIIGILPLLILTSDATTSSRFCASLCRAYTT